VNPNHERREVKLAREIRRVYEEFFHTYGMRKVLKTTRQRAVHRRWAADRLMRSLGLQGVIRGSKHRTTISKDGTDRRADQAHQQFKPILIIAERGP
jgi:putative transposase